MTVRIRRIAAAVVASLALLAASATAASAQYPPAAPFGVSCTPGSPVAGDAVSCSVVGANSGEALTATAEYNPVFYETDLTADADGEAAFAFQVPAEAQGSTVTVTVVGAESGAIGTSVAVEVDGDGAGAAPVTPPSGDRLPMTGVEVGGLLGIGVALLAAGLVALRRREDAKVSAHA